MDSPLFHAVGCVVRHGHKVLLLRRSDQKSYPRLWGLPSGKVEADETILRAVVRELFEETRILISAEQIELFATYRVANTDMEFDYSTFLHIVEAAPTILTNPIEHSDYCWVTKEDLSRFELVPKLKEILEEVERALSPQGQLQLFEMPSLGPRSDIGAIEIEVTRSLGSSSLVAPLGPSKPWYVAIGPPGAGKSTTLKRMSELRPALRLCQDNTILRPGTRLNTYLKEAFERGNISNFFHFQMEVLPLRWSQALFAPAHALVDESIFSTLAYSRALLRLRWISEAEYQTFFLNYSRYAALLSKPDKVFYVRCDAETLKRRIRRRGRAIEVFYGRPYLEMLIHCFEEVSLELAASVSVQRIDTTRMSIDEIVARYAPET